MNLNGLPRHHNMIGAAPPPPSAAHSHHFHTAFYWGKEAQFLFSGWPDNNSGMYALALILVFVLAIIVEFLPHLNLVKPGLNRVAAVSFQTGLYAIRAGFGYMVILAVMSYNGGVFIAAVLGHAVGLLMGFWNSYLMRLFPGWPEFETLYEYCFSLLLLFCLTFTAEFCSNYPIKSDRRLAAIGGAAALRGLKMFMTYLAVVAIIATDFVSLLVAVGGHAAGYFVAGLYQYHIQEAESTLYHGGYCT